VRFLPKLLSRKARENPPERSAPKSKTQETSQKAWSELKLHGKMIRTGFSWKARRFILLQLVLGATRGHLYQQLIETLFFAIDSTQNYGQQLQPTCPQPRAKFSRATSNCP